jgi:hypothetical protein
MKINKNIWNNFKVNATRGKYVYIKAARDVPSALHDIFLFIALNLTYLVAPFAWLYFAITRDEEAYAEIVKRYEKKLRYEKKMSDEA